MLRSMAHLAVATLLILPFAATLAEESEQGPILKEGVIPSDWPQSKTAAEESPTLVMLPAQFEVDDVDRYAVVGELLSDALAAQLSATGKLHLVDRAQVDQLLAEQQLDPERVRPLTSFDAMVRLDLRPQALVPTMQVDVIDISTGNPLAEVMLDWPLDEHAVPKMAKVCLTAVEKIAAREGNEKRRTRVRLLGPIYDVRQPRLAPLVARMRRLLEQSLDASEQIERVMHLESGSAKQESLFLLMGLSRLEGGRQFVPNADATIELEMEEVDAVGKTFEETPIRVRARVRQGNALAGDWEAAQLPSRDFEKLSADVWTKLAGKLAVVDRNAAAEVIKENKLRRKLAEAELNAKLPPSELRIERMLAQIKIAEAALKIDPTYDDARIQLLEARAWLAASYSPGSTSRSVSLEAGDRYLAELLSMAENPIDDRYKLLNPLVMSPLAVRFTPLSGLGYALETDRMFPSDRRNWPELRSRRMDAARDLSDDDIRRLLALRAVVDFAMSDPRTAYGGWSGTIKMVARGMRVAELPRIERIAWVKSIAARSVELRKQIHLVRPRDRSWFPRSGTDYIILSVGLLLEDGAEQDAGEVLMTYREILLSDSSAPLKEQINRILESLADRSIASKFHDPKSPLVPAKEPVRLLSIPVNGWPQPDLFTSELQVPHIWMQTPQLAAVAGDSKRMYMLTSGRGEKMSWEEGGGLYQRLQDTKVMYHELDDDGRPRGDGEVLNAIPNCLRMQNNLREMPQPKFKDGYGEVVARVLDSKLYLATATSGLFVFDPDTDSWKQFNVESGLPTNEIHSFFPTNDRTFLCTGKVRVPSGEGSASYHNLHFTLDAVSGEARLLRKQDAGQLPWYATRLTHVWRQNERWDGLAPWHHYEGLLSENLKATKNNVEPFDAAEIGDRKFYSTASGLHEFDADGEEIHKWSVAGETTIQVGPRSRHGLKIMHLPDSPVEGRFMASSGGMLFMTQWNSRIVAYDPANDTWYGPWAPKLPVQYMGATSEGIWLTASMGTLFVHADDFRKAAIDSGHALTTQEFRQRQQTAVSEGLAASRRTNSAKGRPQFPDRGQDKDWQHGLLALRARAWSTAAAAFDRSLESVPDNAYALLFAGIAHDRWCWKQPDKALAYYEKLAEHDDRDAAFTGVYWAMQNRMAQREYSRVVELATRLAEDFPQIADQQIVADINHWKQEAQRQLK